MRVALLHNVDAGARLDPRTLRREIENGGHEIVVDIFERSQFDLALSRSIDLVAVAGGDGTVRSAVHALYGRGVPLAILPVGTANNIARSLGLAGPPGELARGWDSARRGRLLPNGVGRGERKPQRPRRERALSSGRCGRAVV